jgi:hypothetical protein
MESVRMELLRLDPRGERVGRVLRRTIDQLLDGQRTGRYRWQELRKTEKTHAGTLVEINLQREFAFADGSAMDYHIADRDVDCKFSQSEGGWEIPPEAWVGEHICLLVYAVDAETRYGAGLIRATSSNLRERVNRDMKRQLSASGRAQINWLWGRSLPLPENVLLHLSPSVVHQVMDPKVSGQERVNRLFRLVQGRIISDSVVATVAQQKDYMKRIRGNGGARTILRREGIVILGGYKAHQKLCMELGLPVPDSGESVSVRLALADEGNDLATHEGPARERPVVRLAGRYWAIAKPSDAVCTAPFVDHFTAVVETPASSNPESQAQYLFD